MILQAGMRPVWLFALLLALSACRAAGNAPLSVAEPTTAATPVVPTVEGPPTRTPIPTLVATAAPTALPVITDWEFNASCGVLLPPFPAATTIGQPALALSATTHGALRDAVPDAAWPALERLLAAPGSVSLAAYQVNRQAEGAYLNAGHPMPLASISKIITLVAYVEAVVAGELNPLEQVTLAELDAYYLPNFDLGAHRRALAELQDKGRIISPDDNPSVPLEEVPWMMIRHSSNAAADYLHRRLGQERIEETAVALGLNDPAGAHSAPCNFLGQFLLMANHERGVTNDQVALRAFAEGGPAGADRYRRELTRLFETYIGVMNFRIAEQEWRAQNRRPTIDTQRYFAGRLAPQGTAGGYAALMARLAQNGLSNPDSSYHARRYLEWPNQFATNQELFSNVGYKNGSLPGVLNTAYYAYRWGDAAPVIVVLFFRDLPQQTYRRWRFDLPHDELARWLLGDPQAIPLLAGALREASGP